MQAFKSLRRAGVPLAAIETADPGATLDECVSIMKGMDENQPAMVWDCIRGLNPRNKAGSDAMKASDLTPENTLSLPEFLGMLRTTLDRKESPLGYGVIFFMNLHRFIREPGIMQGLWNLRDSGKGNGFTAVVLCPAMKLPEELKNDMVVLSEPLPSDKEIEKACKSLVEDAGLKPETFTSCKDKVIDTLRGLSLFGAEQVLAMSLGKEGVNMDDLWQRKRKMIEQTPGLEVWKGGESFDDLGGLTNLKDFLSRVLTSGNTPVRAIGFIDEIEKALAGAGGDTSGTSQDQLGVLLKVMQDKAVPGIILIGHPGTGKCQPKGSKVLMSNGTWKSIEHITVGDMVVSPQRDGTITSARVTSTAAYENEPIFNVETLGRTRLSYKCSGNHTIPLHDLQRGERPARKLKRVLREASAYKLMLRPSIKGRIFTSPAVEFQSVNHVVHPYVVGAMLGDGTICGKDPCLPRFCSSDDRIIDRMKLCGVTFGKPRCVGKVKHVNITGASAIDIKCLPCWGTDSYTKFIPEQYLRDSIDNRLELLAGLIDTDGSRDSFTSASLRLAHDFKNLIQSIGGMACVRQRITHCNGKPFVSYRVHYALAEHQPRLCIPHKSQGARNMEWKNPRRRAFRVTPVGVDTVYGFELDSPSQWYVTDDWLVTHNSAIAKAAGNVADAPVIAMDTGAMKGSLVGESEQKIRAAMDVFDAVSQGKGMFIATCNKIASLPPELRRRFTLGTFFVDLPSEEERKKIWPLWIKRYNLKDKATDAVLKMSNDWSGAEIRACCDVAFRTGLPLEDASKFVVPVIKSAPEQVRTLRAMAHNRFIDASRPGVYQFSEMAANEYSEPTRAGRKIDV